MIFTTSKSLDAWGRILHDLDLAAAIVESVLERGRHLTLDGPVSRAHHLGLGDCPHTPGISTATGRGVRNGPGRFSEPTPDRRYFRGEPRLCGGR
jgi:hypothetical protein